MNGMLGLARIFDRFARSVGKMAGWLILPLIFVIMFDVITRKLDFTRLYFADYTAASGFSVSTVLQDMQWHLHAVLLMLTFGFGYLTNAHVRVDVFRELLTRRAQGWLEFCGLIILGIPFLVLMIYYATDLAGLSFMQGEGSDSLTGIGKRWIVKSAMPVGFVIAMIAVLATLIRLIAYLFGTVDQQEEALDGLEIFADEHDELDAARMAAERALEETLKASGGGR